MVLHVPAAPARLPCVVACHGLRASKDSDKYLLLAKTFTAAGIALARFDFRGSGESTGNEAETTVGTRVRDTGAVIEHLRAHPRLDGRLGILGSSMGGFVALHVAHERQDLVAVVTWNAPADLSGLAVGDEAASHGLGVPFAREQASGCYARTPTGVPRHLVIQAEADEVVAPEHGTVLHARAAAPRELVMISGADHRLSAPGDRGQAAVRSLAWFLRFLG